MNSRMPLQELHKILLSLPTSLLIVKTSQVWWVSNLAKKITGKYMADRYCKNWKVRCIYAVKPTILPKAYHIDRLFFMSNH